MIARVVKALDDAWPDGHKEVALKVIKAMREPTEKMINTGSFIDTAQSGVYSSHDVYTAMIDSILDD